MAVTARLSAAAAAGRDIRRSVTATSPKLAENTKKQRPMPRSIGKIASKYRTEVFGRETSRS